ncbi:MAG: STAS domain-containing protein [Planctomycetales bacterium]|nr:STAS domain-containing protein [Planctomycetales bacterium]
MDKAAEENPEPAQDQKPYSLEKIRGYCVIELDRQYSDINWGELQESTSEIIAKVAELSVARVMVDLTRLERINSGLIAVLVRLWKSLPPKMRRMSVITDRDEVHHVFTVAGLHKLWTITDSREEGAYELGYSEKSDREERELRVLALGSLPFAMLAAVTLLPLAREGSEVFQTNAQLSGLLLGAMALTAGVVSVFKDHGIRRVFSIAAIVISLAVLSTIVFEQNPISFRTTVQPKPAGMDTE